MMLFRKTIAKTAISHHKTQVIIETKKGFRYKREYDLRYNYIAYEKLTQTQKKTTKLCKNILVTYESVQHIIEATKDTVQISKKLQKSLALRRKNHQ